MVSAQVVTQVPAQPVPPAPVSAVSAEDARLREALRNANSANALSNQTGFAIVISTNTGTVSLSLNEAIRLGLEHNLQLQVSRYTPIISQFDYRRTYGYYDPTFNSSISSSSSTRESGGFNAVTGQQFPASTSSRDGMTAGLSGFLPTGLSYDLGFDFANQKAKTPFDTGLTNFNGKPIFGKRSTDTWDSGGIINVRQPLLRNMWIDAPRLAIKLTRNNVRISELDFETSLMTVITTIEKAYYDLIAARETVTVQIAAVAVKQQFFDENTRRVQVGTLAPLDAQLAAADLAQAKTQLIVARNAAVTAEAVLKGLISDNFLSMINTRLELTDQMLAVAVNVDLQDAFKQAMENRPELQRTRIQLQNQNLQLKYDFNQLFPQLDIFGTWGVNGLDPNLGNSLNDLTNKRYPEDRYGLSISVPLSMQSERMAYKASKAAKAQAILLLKQQEEAIIQAVYDDARRVQALWEAIPLTRERTIYSKAALEAEQKKVAAGKSTTYDVLNIASDLTRAQVTEIIAVRDYNAALADLAFREGTTLQRRNVDRPSTPGSAAVPSRQ
jgi:outer membrane protein